MVTVNSKGEIADVLDVSQFIGGRSAYECVSYSASLIYYCGEPGHGPTGSVLDASNLAQYWYGKEEGSNASSNTNGMSLLAQYDMLQKMGLQYQGISPWIGAIKATLQEGLPLLLCGAETGMYDVGLGDIVPYAWTPTGNHCIVVSGIAPDGNLLVHDCASIAPTGVRPGPRVYDAAKLQIVSVTAVTPRWKGKQVMGGIPGGWKDVNNVLYSPNNVQGQPDVPITGPFRDYILTHPWENGNLALEVGHHVDVMEQHNSALGSGFVQAFRYARLLMPDSGSSAGKVIYGWLGLEMLWLENALQQAQFDLATQKHEVATLTTQLQQANAQIATEQAQVKTLQTELASHPDVTALSNRFSAIGMNIKQAETYLTEAQNQAALPIS